MVIPIFNHNSGGEFLSPMSFPKIEIIKCVSIY